LTEYGIKVMQEKAPYKFTVSGWRGDTKEFTTELWDLMNLFGEEMWMGSKKMVFENNVVKIMEEL